MKVKFKRFNSGVQILQKTTKGSACYDLLTASSIICEPKANRSIETDLGFAFTKKYMARFYPRSSLSLQLIFVEGSVVDADYRGNVKVILTNLSDRAKEFETGDRIAQLLFIKKEQTEFQEVSEFDETERGCKGS